MKKLVVIDDEYIVVEGIKAMIARLQIDYEVVGFAYDGISALEVIEKTAPDIVITDIRIPGMDGLSLIECAKEILPDTIFIVISGYQEFEYARRALSLGVRGYIDKPITMNKLKDILAKIEEEDSHKSLLSLKEEKQDTIQLLVDQLMKSIRHAENENIRPYFTEVLTELKAEFKNFESYRGEVYKVVCVCLGIFFEEHKIHDLDKHFPSYKNLEILKTYEEMDAYAYVIADRMTEKLKVLNTGSVHQIIVQLLEFINENYSKDVGLNEFADRVSMNPAYLSILFKDEVGVSYVKYLTKVRIDHAKELLLAGKKVTEVSELVGYHDYRYFCNIFKKNDGQTPNEYKGNIRKIKEI